MSIPAPQAGPDAEFLRRLGAGDFCLQRCADCAAWVFYPRVLCPHCGADRLGWHRASGRGTVYSRAVLHRRPEKGGPHAVVLVDLEEGPRMMSRLPGTDPADIRIGQPVTARIETGEDGPVVVFDPVAPS